MGTCEVCGNEYDKSMDITVAGGTVHTFDSFECAIHAIAPRCEHCGCAIIGHGNEAGDAMYCCAHCAREAGHAELADRVAS
jgi:NAD(P)H-hydrate repair Nnr-like enzyme with NAD(P)H-hydrate epimerase domain